VPLPLSSDVLVIIVTIIIIIIVVVGRRRRRGCDEMEAAWIVGVELRCYMSWHGMALHGTAWHGIEVNDSNVEDEGSVKTMKMGKFIGS